MAFVARIEGYTIRSEGTPIRNGGKGVTWHCDCPAFRRLYRGGNVYAPSCKHVRAIWRREGTKKP